MDGHRGLPPRALYIGGPVKQDAALCLGVMKHGHDVEDHPALRPVDGRVVLVDLDADPEPLAEVLVGVRIFAGGTADGESDSSMMNWTSSAGCSPPHSPATCWPPPATDVWFDILRRQPWPMPLLATHPIDLSLN